MVRSLAKYIGQIHPDSRLDVVPHVQANAYTSPPHAVPLEDDVGLNANDSVDCCPVFCLEVSLRDDSNVDVVLAKLAAMCLMARSLNRVMAFRTYSNGTRDRLASKHFMATNTETVTPVRAGFVCRATHRRAAMTHRRARLRLSAMAGGSVVFYGAGRWHWQHRSSADLGHVSLWPLG